jgi:hemoglobin-like flavoprotein
MVNNGMRVFNYIFIRRPEVKNLFPFKHLEMTELSTNPYFRGHATHFMQAISAAVDNLDDLDTKLTPLLLAFGEQHGQTRGFGIQYFEVFTQCLVLVWEERLGDKFTPKVRAAWEKLFVFILMTLREGYVQARGYYDSQEWAAEYSRETHNA